MSSPAADVHGEVAGQSWCARPGSPPCAHPSTRRRLLSPLSCIAYGWAIALGGRWDAKTSSSLRCPHTFPRAATPDGTRALPTRRR